MLGAASVRLMSTRRGWFLPLVLVLITAAVVTAIATSSLSGTGTTDVDDEGTAVLARGLLVLLAPTPRQRQHP